MEYEKEFMFAGRLEKFVFRKLNWGEKNKIKEDALDIRIIGGQQIIRVSPVKMIENAVVKCLVRAPCTIDLASIQGLDDKLGEAISDYVIELNNLNQKKN